MPAAGGSCRFQAGAGAPKAAWRQGPQKRNNGAPRTSRGNYAQPLKGLWLLKGQLHCLLEPLLHLLKPANVIPGNLRRGGWSRRGDRRRVGWTFVQHTGTCGGDAKNWCPTSPAAATLGTSNANSLMALGRVSVSAARKSAKVMQAAPPLPAATVRRKAIRAASLHSAARSAATKPWAASARSATCGSPATLESGRI